MQQTCSAFLIKLLKKQPNLSKMSGMFLLGCVVCVKVKNATEITIFINDKGYLVIIGNLFW